jgi:hypothetical protein
MVLLKFRKEFARRPYTTLSEIYDFMKVTAVRESSDIFTSIPPRSGCTNSSCKKSYPHYFSHLPLDFRDCPAGTSAVRFSITR